MPLTIAYLLKLSISLSLVYLFYQIFLRRLTFHHWNRWYLLGYSLLSFFIPFINITPLVETKGMGDAKLIDYIPVVNNYILGTKYLSTASSIYSLDKWDILLFFLLLGIFFFALRLFIQLISLWRLRQKSTLINNAGTTIYQVDKHIIPFSFGNAIYINQELHGPRELEEIILHEYVHVKQKHSIDILFMELVCILNWFNPFAWLLRHAVRQNLEFIADDDVLKKGLDKKAYQYHLLQVVGLSQYRIANSFNLSSLKKRIAMMNKFRSAKIHLIKFLFLLPLIAILLLAFREKAENGLLNIKPSHIEGKRETINDASILTHFSKMEKTSQKSFQNTKNYFDTIPSSTKLPDPNNDTSKFDFKNVLVFIDNVEVPKGIDWATLIKPDAIKSVSVYKGKSALDKFGEKGKYGVMSIETKPKDSKSTLHDTLPYAIDASQKLVTNGKVKDIIVIPVDKPSPLYILDGNEVKSISDVNPNQIESINVLKDSMVVKQNGERGRNGVILIKTKKLSYHSPSQSDKPDLQNNPDLVGTSVHPIKNQPMAIVKNNRSGRDTIIFIADTIEYNKSNLRLSGTMTIYDSVTSTLKGNFFFAKKGDMPFLVFNGKKINRINNFKAVNGQYRILSLNRELAMAKYNDRRAENGAIEISSL